MKNILLTLIVITTIAFLYILTFWNNKHSLNSNYILKPTSVEEINELLKDVDQNVKIVISDFSEKVIKNNNNNKEIIKQDDKNVEQEISLYNNKICNNYKTILKNIDINEQIKIVEETKIKLNNNENISDFIYNFVPRGLTDGYATHALPLIVSALTTTGDMLELGIGKYSTPALNKIAKLQRKFLLSTESEQNWMQNFVNLNDTTTHLIISSFSDCAKSINEEKKWGLVFVDHLQGERRHLDMIKYANKAQIVIAHDSEKNSNGYYLYDKAYPYFKYHCKSSLYLNDARYISTSILSNFISLENIEKILKNIDIHLKHVVCDQNMKKRKKK